MCYPKQLTKSQKWPMLILNIPCSLIACENIRFSSFFSAGDVLHGNVRSGEERGEILTAPFKSMNTLKFKSQLTFASLLPSTILTEISENRSLLQLNSIQFNSKGHGLRFVTGKFLFSWSKFMISLRTKCACIRRTVHGLSQKQNSMRHKSLYEYMLGDCQWCHVALRHGAFAFPGNIDFAADDHCIF